MGGRKSYQHGKAGEHFAALRLKLLGVACVEEIPTQMSRGGRYLKKASGDIRGVLPPSGRSVLCEVKTTQEARLPWSALRKHQPHRLNEHAEAGGLSLLAWYNLETGDLFVVRWQAALEAGFAPRTSLDIETARMLNVQSL